MTRYAAPTVIPAPIRDDTSAMHDRVPAQALIEQVLGRQASGRRRSTAERLIGRDPVAPEARGWFAGAQEERFVASRLAGLPTGWTVLHSLPSGRNGADIDHLVVGPGGVFTVSAKHHTDASVWVAGGTVLVAGTRKPWIARAEAEARRVDRIVAEVLDDAPAVRPVVALVGAKRLAVRTGPAGVAVLRAEHLRRFLRTQPARLTPEQVRRLVAVLDAPSRWQPSAEAGPELLLAFAALSREVRTAARVRAAWGVTGAAAVLAAVLAAPGAMHVLAG